MLPVTDGRTDGQMDRWTDGPTLIIKKLRFLKKTQTFQLSICVQSFEITRYILLKQFLVYQVFKIL